jgi:hypothetical protein
MKTNDGGTPYHSKEGLILPEQGCFVETGNRTYSRLYVQMQIINLRRKMFFPA